MTDMDTVREKLETLAKQLDKIEDVVVQMAVQKNELKNIQI